MSLYHSVRAGAPPSYLPLIDFERLKKPSSGSLKFLDQYADLRADRESEIMSQMSGGLTFLGAVAYLHPERTKWTIELLGAALRLAIYAEMRVKQGLWGRRPVEFSPQVQPMIQTPAHGTIPSGHSTESFTAALVLLRLLQAAPINQPPSAGDKQIDFRYSQQLMRIACASPSTAVAGVHFPVDSAAGCVFGLTLRFSCSAASAQRPVHRLALRATTFPNPAPTANPPAHPARTTRLLLSALFDVTGTGNQTPTAYATSADAQSLQYDTASIALPWLWQQAKAEWT